MKKNITTAVIVTVYNLLNAAKITKMEDTDKFSVIKALRKLKAVTKDFEEFKKDTEEKLKPEDYDAMLGKAQQWQKEGENTTLTEEERIGINKFFNSYTSQVNECIKEEVEKIHALDITPLSEESLGKLIASNDWTLGQIDVISEVVGE